MWITRSSGFSTSQTSLTPSSHRCSSSAAEVEVVHRGEGQVAERALGEHRRLRDHVGAGLEVRERLAVPAAALVAGAHAAHDPVLDQQLGRGGLGQDVDARLLGLLGEEAAELRDRDHVVAVVAEVRRHRLERQRLLRGEQVDGVLLDLPETGHSDSGMSGKSSFIADGRMFAPESRCAPGVLPFSITATGTSPSFSISSGSFSSSCISRFAQARPAGPPPTIATPTSMRSSSGSVGGPTNSSASFTGGGYSAGCDCGPCRQLSPLLRLHGLGQLRHDLVEVAHDPEVAELEDRRVRVLVDRDDVLRGLHADLVLDRARDAGREVELRRDRLAGLADLRRVREPARVDDRARRGDGAAERAGELLAEVEVLGLAEPAAAGHEEVGVLDVDVGTALLAARAPSWPSSTRATARRRRRPPRPSRRRAGPRRTRSGAR